jgi:hypothetical protein
MEIPKVIIQTYSTKSKIPKKIYDNISKYGEGYEHVIFDDQECRHFLQTHYGQSYVQIFNSFRRGQHKADFFRYCYLYERGGVYLDIKIELIKPLDEIIHDSKLIYSVMSIHKNTMFQGIIFTPPKAALFRKAIDNMIETIQGKRYYRYGYFTEVFYEKMKEDAEDEDLKRGMNIGKENNYFLFQEICDKNRNSCYDGLDRHGFCCYTIDENDEKVFKNRYAEFGRKW